MVYSLHRYLFMLLLLYAPLLTRAETFIVTSAGDSGPGTLRDAILKSNANGTGEKDYIHFNLPYTTWAERTIILDNGLPAITGGNLVIDGTTQPGDKLGLSDAKVIIMRNPDVFWDAYFAISLRQADDVEIYGLNLIHGEGQGFYNGYCITMEDVRRLKIGAPGKGNLIYSFRWALYREAGFVEDLVIQGNMIGIHEDGVSGKPVNIQLQGINGILFGGSGPGEGNHLGSANMQIETTGGRVIIQGNKMGTDYTGNLGIDDFEFQLSGDATEMSFTDNHIGYGSLTLYNLQYPFAVLRNKFGTDASGTQNLPPFYDQQIAIQAFNCSKGLISENAFSGYFMSAISLGGCYATTISRNEMICNQWGISLNWNEAEAGRPKPYVGITSCNAGGTGGIATPNSKIELFEPVYCNGASGGFSCQGRRYITTITADADGKWFFPSAPANGIIATATDEGGATSPFSIAEIDYDESPKVAQPTCGRANGSIKMKVNSGIIIGWKDGEGNLISTDTSLYNLAPGEYSFHISSSGCDNETCVNAFWFTLEDATPSIDAANVIITNASCNQNNGYITNLSISGTTANTYYTWHNELGEIAGDSYELLAVRPGKYTLTVTQEDNCTATAGPFEIKNTDGPVVDISHADIAAASCGEANGSITGISITGTGTISYQWVNAEGKLIGTANDLAQVQAGKYVLKYRDDSGCPEAETDTFTVAGRGEISISTANMIVTPAGCVTDQGSITGIEIISATSFRWVNETGQTVSTGPDLQNASPGKYRLLLENAEGCEASTDLIEITRRQATPLRILVMATRPAHCDKNNGAITTLTITGGTPSSYRWMSENGQLASTEERPADLAPGIYKLYVTDDGGCEQYLISATISQTAAPIIDTRNLKITPDECGLSAGSIDGITITGEAPFSYAWYSGNTIKGQNLALTGIPAGDYYLQITDQYGCKVQSPGYHVSNEDNMLPPPIPESPAVVNGMPAIITVPLPQEGTYHLYAHPGGLPLQSNSAGSFRLEGIVKSTPFYIRLQSGSCFSPFAEVLVKVVDEIKVIAPNAFTPNNDGINDRFLIHTYGLSRLDYFTVFNRWGAPVFTTNNPNDWWDGRMNSAPQPAGTYTWIVKGKDILGKDVQYAGHVLLIR